MKSSTIFRIILLAIFTQGSARGSDVVQVTLTLKDGKTTYRAGEPIILDLSFAANEPGHAIESGTTEPPSPIDEIVISPKESVSRWLDDASGRHQYTPDAVMPPQQISPGEPSHILLRINSVYRIDKPTLGVITMGIRHMTRVQAALDHASEGHPELGQFFDSNKSERFFIKNLERVQGDERDSIIISIGYGKDRAGNLPLRFGPLIPEGGRRRLNVAVTRARQNLTVVSSFSHLDIDLVRVRPGSGVELLRNYLQYASTNGKRLGDAQMTTEPLNAFEAEVFDCLSGKGLKLIPQMGASHFRIDMVAEHPQKPGRYVLAIECDGATYHSSYTARDRDRLRQQQLENLGWRFHRIWSTDWFMRKEDELQRAMTAFQKAVE